MCSSDLFWARSGSQNGRVMQVQGARPSELKIVRFLMVLGSASPLLVLWAELHGSRVAEQKALLLGNALLCP